MTTEMRTCSCDNYPCKQKGFAGCGVLGEIITQKPEITYNNNRTFPNGKKAPDGIEIRFGNTRPTEAVREQLKAAGFRFSEKQTLWYAKDNEKSRKLVESLQEGTEVDNTQYEKHHFWARVKSSAEYDKLRSFTEFMVTGNPPAFYFNKSALQKSVSVQGAISAGLLSFKKFYNKVVGEEEEGQTETAENESDEEESTVNLKVAEKLQALADRMQKQIDAKLNSPITRQRPTARRMRIASGMRQDGRRLEEIQSFFYALANGHRTGKIREYKFLKNIRTRSQVEMINLYSIYSAGSGAQAYFDRHRKEFEKLGITSVFEWSKAVVQRNELLSDHSPREINRQREQEDKLRELEMRIISMKIPGFFPTPITLIKRMIQLAAIKKGNTILEPSAGKGDILDALKEEFSDSVSLKAIERHSTLREILSLKGYDLAGTDFLEHEPAEKYDRILMNPPFENGQDVDHVMHALKLLKPEGRLVAIMSEGVFFRQFKKDQAFRQLLKIQNAYISEPIKDAFKDGFIQTGVNVRIVAINKNGKPINDEMQEKTELDAIELEALAEIELLKMRVEKVRKEKGLDGISKINPLRLQKLKLRAWTLKQQLDV